MTGKLAALLLAWAVSATLAFAQTPATSGDPRIRIVPYEDNRIVPLRGHLGYQMLVEFDPAERIENVAIGDSLAWQVTPNRAATLLFLKPIQRGAATNMTVITTLRRYSFELSARDASGPSDPSIIYTVRFAYPVTAAPPPPAPPPQPSGPALTDLNLAYSTKGNGRMPAVRAFDDGRSTYFQFGETADAPAIFLVGRDGKEELVNSQWRGQYMVVDQVGHEFILRVGRQSVRVRNEAWTEPQPVAPANEGRR